MENNTTVPPKNQAETNPVANVPPEADKNDVPSKPKGFLNLIKHYYSIIDLKTKKYITDDKLRKIMIIVVGSFSIFFVFILLLGILVSLGRPRNTNPLYTLNKTVIPTSSPKPEAPKTKTQEKLVILKDQLNKLSFPTSEITPPDLIKEIDITE